jgi:hypothetical protein
MPSPESYACCIEPIGRNKNQYKWTYGKAGG